MDDRHHLEHHGILGMHWGIRRYQPYPKGRKAGKEVGEAAKTKEKRESRWNKKSPVGKVATVAGIAAGASLVVSAINFVKADAIIRAASNGEYKALKLSAVSPAVKQAGKMAIASSLITIGGMTISDMQKAKKSQSSNGAE